MFHFSYTSREPGNVSVRTRSIYAYVVLYYCNDQYTVFSFMGHGPLSYLFNFDISHSILQEKHMKDCLRVIGLMEHVYWLSWLVIYLLICVVISTVIVALFWFGGIFSVRLLALGCAVNSLSNIGF